MSGRLAAAALLAMSEIGINLSTSFRGATPISGLPEIGV